ncbi:hypothetical protein N8I77_008932 [Diaporthe amygdali]|uniref:Cytochrome P450 n=1 Tax=Phomopsis amygdali TaxID=1214568 RepID=A0AAD9SA32_PHOAM|nr:hypothetical protein N8I77_008932 [Diaporthe amygdali]
MPGQRIYVVNSVSLIPALQRQIKTIAFAPIEAQAAATVMGVGPSGNAIIGSDRMLEDGSYLSTFVPSIQPALGPGPGLDAINGSATRYIADSLEFLNSKSPKTLELFSWIRGELFMATTESICGPQNPFRDSALEKAWYYVKSLHCLLSSVYWMLKYPLTRILNSNFEPGIMIHMLKAWPGIMARKSLHAREHLLIPAFEKYFAEDGHRKGSLLVQCRYNHNIGHGLQGRDVAATEIGQMVASLTNSMASAFWMVYHIFSDPTVLKECREEVEQLVQVTKDGTCAVDLTKVKSSCPILLSTGQETLRYSHIGIAARTVMEDTMLANQYLLKKGATVMTVTPVQHTEEALWGPTVSSFDHHRFLREPGRKRTNPVAFRAFGGGTVLCPGRHFVSTEVMSFTALLLLRFDLRPATQDGKWAKPRKNFPMTSSMPTPKDEVQVEIVPRDKPGRKWHVTFSASGKGVEITAEDENKGDS